jgi:hypothetical protein
VENLQGKVNVGDAGIDGKIILKWNEFNSFGRAQVQQRTSVDWAMNIHVL